VNRKTVKRYVAAAEELGLSCDGGEGQLTDLFIGSVVEAGMRHSRNRAVAHDAERADL
jgi:hypothetical protein